MQWDKSFLLLFFKKEVLASLLCESSSSTARWASFVENAVKNGRYGSASEVVREGLRLVEEREARLASLRETLDAGTYVIARRYLYPMSRPLQTAGTGIVWRIIEAGP